MKDSYGYRMNMIRPIDFGISHNLGTVFKNIKFNLKKYTKITIFDALRSQNIFLASSEKILISSTIKVWKNHI